METFDPTPADVITDSTPERVQRVEEGLATLAAVFPQRHAAPVRVNLEVDLSPAVVTPGYAARLIDRVELNTTPQRATLKLLAATLTAHRAELIDGTRIQHPQQAIQWLLEQLAIRLPSPLLDELMEGVQ